jgi:hypothetical protein
MDAPCPGALFSVTARYPKIRCLPTQGVLELKYAFSCKNSNRRKKHKNSIFIVGLL